MLTFLRNSFESSSIFGKVTETILPMFLVMTSIMLVMTAMQIALKLRQKRIRAENGISDKE